VHRLPEVRVLAALRPKAAGKDADEKAADKAEVEREAGVDAAMVSEQVDLRQAHRPRPGQPPNPKL
jgi:hypothetical protein